MSKIPLGTIITASIALTAVGVIGYIGYRTVKVVSKIGTGENIKAAGAAVWEARPRIIFKGIDDDLETIGGLIP